MVRHTSSKKIDNLVVSYSDQFGGAAKAAFRINECLNDSLILSKMLVIKKISESNNVISYENKIGLFLFKIKNKLLILIKKILKSKIDRSFNIFKSPLLKIINNINPKIVNLNWIGAETLSLKDISKIKKSKIIFTLHDMWAFCGTEHYVYDNKNYKFIKGYNYSDAKSLLSFFDIYQWKKKISLWKNFYVIAPSKWLSNLASKSILMKNCQIFTIPYPINTKKFYYKKNRKNKKKINIIFSTFGDINNPRKNFSSLQNILDKLDPNKFTLNLIGNSTNKILKDKKYQIKFHNSLQKEKAVIKVLNDCDLFVFTSKLDNFPLALMEAQSCGLPCIAYNTGGVADIIINNRTGFLIKPFDENKFAEKIKIFIENKKTLKQFSINSRKNVEKNFSYPVIRKKYEQIFKKII